MKHVYCITAPPHCPTAPEAEAEEGKDEETEAPPQSIAPADPEPLILLEFD